MRTWGQWLEDKEIYSFRINTEDMYRFHHWTTDGYWANNASDLLKDKKTKFYLTLIY